MLTDDSIIWNDTILIGQKNHSSQYIQKHKGSFTPRFDSGKSAWNAHFQFIHDIIAINRPSVIVELGVYFGDSYFAMCQACEELELDTKCYGVDSWFGDDFTGPYSLDVFRQANSYNSEFYNEFSFLLKMPFNDAADYFEDHSVDFLHIDGSHSYKEVSSDYQLWKSKVKKGGIIAFHDVNIHSESFGVIKLWNELSKQFTSELHDAENGLGLIYLD